VRWSFAKAKDGSQKPRDNSAAWVAGPGRICFEFFLRFEGGIRTQPNTFLRNQEMGKSILGLLVMLLVALVSVPSIAQAPANWQDELADHISGNWKVEGRVLGREAHHEADAEWVLNHQFLCIHEKTAASAPASEHRYEALWFLGYDAVSERYVLHLIDIFGGRFSETLGYGARSGNEIRFVFEYPDGPFHTTFRWSPEDTTWRWLLEQKDKDGKWTTFADLRFARAK
jgi:hypothetical protein